MTRLHWLHSTETLALTALGLTVMMSVMMAPTVAPWVAAFHRFGVVATNQRRHVSTLMFASGYAAAWAVFAVAVALAQTAADDRLNSGGLILIGAGLFQFTSL